MFRISFSEQEYLLLKSIDFSELEDNLVFFDEERRVEIKRSAFRLFQVIISEEIAQNGLTDDQNDVTPHGRRLYALYDFVTDQKDKQLATQ